MMKKKRFNIVSSKIVEDGKFIQDNNKKYSFPTTRYSSSLVMYEKALNELSDENEQLKNMIRHDYEERKKVINNYCDKIKKIEKENEELKKENQELKRKLKMRLYDNWRVI